MEISFEKKKILKTRIKELESQLEEKNFILKTLKHQNTQIKEKIIKPNNSFTIVNNYLKVQPLPHINSFISNDSPKPPLNRGNKAFIGKTPVLKRILNRANSLGKCNKTQNESTCEETHNKIEINNNDNFQLLVKDFQIKNEKLKQKITKISEKFIMELSNKDKEINELKKYKISYSALTEKMKMFPVNSKIDVNAENQGSCVNLENENLKEEIKFLQQNLEEKDFKLKSSLEDNEKNRDKIEKMGNKLKYIMFKKQELEKQLQFFKEKTFQTDLLIKKLENDVTDRTNLILNLKNNLRDAGSTLEFENKKPESMKNVNNLKNK